MWVVVALKGMIKMGRASTKSVVHISKGKKKPGLINRSLINTGWNNINRR